MREPTDKQNRTFVPVCGLSAVTPLFFTKIAIGIGIAIGIAIGIEIGIAIEIGINGVLLLFVVYPR